MRSFYEEDEMEQARRSIRHDREERHDEINYGDFTYGSAPRNGPIGKKLSFLKRLRLRIAEWWNR